MTLDGAETPAPPLLKCDFNFGATLVVADHPRQPHVRGVRLLNSLAVLGRRKKQSRQRIAYGGSVAVLLGRDPRLEGLWSARGRLGPALRGAGFSAVIAPGFSTWWDDSPFAAIVAIRRTMQVAVDLAPYLDVIPTVVWRYHKDLDEWSSWLVATRSTVIAMDLGTLRSRARWLWAVEGIRYLAEQLSGAQLILPRLVVSGPCKVDRLRDVVATWPGPVTFASQKAWQLAVHGSALLHDLTTETAARHESREDLLLENAASFETACARAMQHGNVRLTEEPVVVQRLA